MVSLLNSIVYYCENFFNRYMKRLCNIPSQYERGIVSSFFKITNRFPSNTDSFCQVLLFHIIPCSKFFNSVLNHCPPQNAVYFRHYDKNIPHKRK
ncbi:hypothetical protein QG9_1627 [Clostridioides difficile CD178]|nr:hypothetical protein QG3_1598 [Clostridioides difficile CD169]EQF52913.1 hypothetical protein QG9_1627 [Clostridioides difficile CD178]EQG49504.1 hypothetical protein QIW_0470 [Clostridioides difficile DA00134]EQG52917.1 hypothetical protein QIY_1674 [Clostridioides difficile DA00141]EQH30962.1 hypothetical protein QM3_0421 [Clostridioides difficile DA00215]EQI75667.1 hypothetical protein QQE_0456 [Clostridioides difficile Y381]EQJ68415.1 hypothetical protein QSU_2007 [Clostridioides diffi